MKWKEILFVLVLVGGLLIPAFLAQQWWLFATFGMFFCVFGFVEWLAVKVSGKTVSQHFWAFSLINKKMAWAVLGCMLLAWLALLWHLAAKML